MDWKPCPRPCVGPKSLPQQTYCGKPRAMTVLFAISVLALLILVSIQTEHASMGPGQNSIPVFFGEGNKPQQFEVEQKRHMVTYILQQPFLQNRVSRNHSTTRKTIRAINYHKKLSRKPNSFKQKQTIYKGKPDKTRMSDRYHIWRFRNTKDYIHVHEQIPVNRRNTYNSHFRKLLQMSQTTGPYSSTSFITTSPETTMETSVPPSRMVTSVPPSTMVTSAPPTTMETSVPPSTMVTSVPPSTMITSAPPTTMETSVPPTTMITSVPPTTMETSVPPSTMETSAPPTTMETSVPPTTMVTSVPPSTMVTSAPPTTMETSVPPTTMETSVPPSNRKRTVSLLQLWKHQSHRQL
ncbi:putative uncharacterized protein ENSP00000383309 [Branchiostoma floridae]|uniref:Uncharacterized protein n=1 Tax=Branchiostoma floridae TaxID=7739 RepID=A0A9J7LRA1_BRAFL|nr:putative uncharacterized protein ENSP00000383309 [Branchiostoma floridae]